MIEPALPPDEAERLAALRALAVLDTPPEERFDRLTRLAQRLFGVPIALIGLIDEDRQWYKSCQGLEGSEAERRLTFCAHAILQDTTLVVPDATLDPRFADNPHVVGEPFVRFYAGQPLRGPGGHRLGTLCLVDKQPREFSYADQRALMDLAVLAEEELKAGAGVPRLGAAPGEGPKVMTERDFHGVLRLNTLLPIGLTIGLGLLLGWQTLQVQDEAHWFVHRAEVRRHASRLSYQLAGIESSQRDFLITGRPTTAARFEQQRAELGETLEAFTEQLRSDTTHAAQSAHLRQAIDAWEANARYEMKLRAGQDPAFLPYFSAGKGARMMEGLQAQMKGIRDEQTRLMGERQQSLLRSCSLAGLVGGLGLLLMLAFFLIFGRRQTQRAAKHYSDNIQLLQARSEDLAAQAEVLRRKRAELEWAHSQLQAHADRVEVEVAERTAALAESENRYRSVVDNVQEVIFQLDGAGRWTFLSPAWREITGYEVADSLGKPLQAFVEPGDRPRHAELLEALLEGKRGFYRHELQFSTQGGGVRWLEISVRPTPAGAGAAGAFGTLNDITERKAAERMKDEFLSIVSHELRTPLASIRGSLSLLASGVLETHPEKGRRMLEIAASSSERLVRLINDILDIDRLNSGKAPLEKHDHHLAPLLLSAAEAMEGMAQKAGVSIAVEGGDAILPLDADRITQVLTNILSNAIKFSPADSTIRLSAERGEGHWLVSVTDEGRGIPEDKLELIFGQFQQVDSSDSRQKGGTGLGLAICKTIVEQHGGRIWAESPHGHGSTFRFTLPEAPVATWARAIVPAAGARVVLCDDDADMREVVGTLLEREGYRVAKAGSGAEALAQCRTERPAALLLDLHMPEMNGWETLASLREDAALADIPVIIFSGLKREEGGALAPNLIDWLGKPLDEASLFRSLDRALGHEPKEFQVLIVEDDLELAQVLLMMFQRHGVEAVHAATSAEALRLSQRMVPALLVLDVLLPDGDGFEVVDWLKRHDHLREVAVVVYSAKDLDAEERRRLTLGPTAFMNKGHIDPTDFEQKVMTLVQRITQ